MITRGSEAASKIADTAESDSSKVLATDKRDVGSGRVDICHSQKVVATTAIDRVVTKAWKRGGFVCFLESMLQHEQHETFFTDAMRVAWNEITTSAHNFEELINWTRERPQQAKRFFKSLTMSSDELEDESMDTLVIGMLLLPAGVILRNTIDSLNRGDDRVSRVETMLSCNGTEAQPKNRTERRKSFKDMIHAMTMLRIKNARHKLPCLNESIDESIDSGRVTWMKVGVMMYMNGYTRDATPISARVGILGDPGVFNDVLIRLESYFASDIGYYRNTNGKETDRKKKISITSQMVKDITDSAVAEHCKSTRKWLVYADYVAKLTSEEMSVEEETQSSDSDTEEDSIEASVVNAKKKRQTQRRGKGKGSKGRKGGKKTSETSNAVFTHHLGSFLLTHNYTQGAKIVDNSDRSLIIAAVSLAYPEVHRILDCCGLPWDLLFSVGARFRKSLKLPSEITYDELHKDGYKFICRCDPVIPVSLRHMLNKQHVSSDTSRGKKSSSKEQERTLLLAPMILSMSHGMLSPDCFRAWIDCQNNLPYCKQGQYSYVRATIIREQTNATVQLPTPIAHVGAESILTVPATEEEALFTQLKAEMGKMLVDATNEFIQLIMGTITEPIGAWRSKYLSEMARKRMPNVKAQTRLGTRREFYAQIKAFCTMDGAYELSTGASCPQIPYPDNKKDIKKMGKGYGIHDDAGKDLNSEPSVDGTCNRGLSSGLVLPTREMMQVVTAVMGVDEATSAAKLEHYRNKEKKGDPESRVLTYENSCHCQSMGLQARDYKHNSAMLNGGIRQSDTSRACLDPLGDKKDMDAYLRFLTTFKDAYVPDSEPRRTGGVGHVVYNRYDYKNVFGRPTKITDAKAIPLWWEKGQYKLMFDEIQAQERKKAGVSEDLPPVQKAPKPNRLTDDQFNKCCHETVTVSPYRKVRGIARPARVLSIQGTASATICRCAKVIETLLTHRRIPVIWDDTGTQTKASVQPLLLDSDYNVPLQPGSWYTNSDMNLNMSSRAKEFINEYYMMAQAIIFIYKNDPSSIDPWVDFTLRFTSYLGGAGYPERDEEKMLAFKKEYESLGPIKTCLTGGSARKAGERAFTISGSRPGDPHISTGTHQKLDSPEGRAFCRAIHEELVLTVGVHKEWMVVERANGLFAEFRQKKTGRKTKKGEEAEAAESEHDTVEAITIDVPDGTVANGDEDDAVFDLPPSDETPFTLAELDINETMRVLNSGNKNSQDILCLGFFAPRKIESIPTLNLKQLSERFSNFPGYVKKMSDNISFLCNGHYQGTMVPAFSFETYTNIYLVNRRLKVCTYSSDQAAEKPATFDVTEDDWDIRVDVEALEKFCLQSLDKDEKDALNREFGTKDQPEVTWYPETLYTRQIVSDYIAWQTHFDDILSIIIPEPTDAKRGLYALTVEQLMIVMSVLMVTAALRSEKQKALSTDPDHLHSIDEEGTDLNEKAWELPLMMTGADHLPDPLRVKPIACSNADYDIARTAVRSNITYLHEEHTRRTTSEKPDELLPIVDATGRNSYRPLCLKKKENCLFLADCLIMAIVARFTGNISHLQSFPKWNEERLEGAGVKTKRFLPTREDVEDYVSFFQAKLAGGTSGKTSFSSMFMSQQHAGSLPATFTNKTARTSFCSFLRRITSEGHPTIVTGLEKSGNDREVLVQCLAMVVSRVAEDIQPGKPLQFIVHQALADVESAFPGFAGEVTYQSLGLGHGSENGLKIMKRMLRKAAPNEEKTNMKRKSEQEAFEELHCAIITQMRKMLEYVYETSGVKGVDVLLLAGWRWDGTTFEFVSVLTGRCFSMSDTEHLCCKVYICVVIAHSSRTISKTPHCYAQHCWPVPTEQHWAASTEHAFAAIRELYHTFPKGFFKDIYPQQLNYFKAVYLESSSDYAVNEAAQMPSIDGAGDQYNDDGYHDNVQASTGPPVAKTRRIGSGISPRKTRQRLPVASRRRNIVRGTDVHEPHPAGLREDV